MKPMTQLQFCFSLIKEQVGESVIEAPTGTAVTVRVPGLWAPQWFLPAHPHPGMSPV